MPFYIIILPSQRVSFQARRGHAYRYALPHQRVAALGGKPNQTYPNPYPILPKTLSQTDPYALARTFPMH